MDDSWLPLIIFVTTSLLVLSVSVLIYEWLFRYRVAVRERIRQINSGPDECHSITLFKDLRNLPADQDQRRSWTDQLQLQLEQAGSDCSARSFVAYCCASGIASAAFGLVWTKYLILPLGFCGAIIPLLVLRFWIRMRRRKMSHQLPEAFAMISRAVKAGQTVPSALQIIAEDFDPPISLEFARCYEQQNLGISRESALRQLARRTGIMELQIFVVAILVQAKSGGDLAELLDNLANMIRKRLKLKDRVRALTGEGRMQAIVLSVLPISALLGIVLIAPDYAQCLLTRPWLLAGTAIAQAAGVFWVRRIVAFEY